MNSDHFFTQILVWIQFLILFIQDRVLFSARIVQWQLQVTGALGEVPKKNREDQNLFWDSCVFFSEHNFAKRVMYGVRNKLLDKRSFSLRRKQNCVKRTRWYERRKLTGVCLQANGVICSDAVGFRIIVLGIGEVRD